LNKGFKFNKIKVRDSEEFGKEGEDL